LNLFERQNIFLDWLILAKFFETQTSKKTRKVWTSKIFWTSADSKLFSKPWTSKKFLLCCESWQLSKNIFVTNQPLNLRSKIYFFTAYSTFASTHSSSFEGPYPWTMTTTNHQLASLQ
jgi:hypothetical protein